MFYEDADWGMLPFHMREPLQRYIEDGLEPGGFLQAVLENDLSGAVSRADSTNIHRIPDFVRFLQYYAPAICWGSPELYQSWVKRRGINGINKDEGQ